jgi:hypothetical protein
MNFIHYGWKMDVCGRNSFMIMLTMMLVNLVFMTSLSFSDEFHKELCRAYFDIIDGVFSHFPWHSINVPTMKHEINMDFHGIWKFELNSHNIDFFFQWWMDWMFGNLISLKVLFWCFIVETKLGFQPWSLVSFCDVC